VTDGRVAVFLDRDGTLNVDVGYLSSPDEMRLIPGAAEAVRLLNDREILTCVISNQSGVARGYLSEADLVPIHARMQAQLAAGGAHLDRIYYCPHHPTAGHPPYNVECNCRKPRTGMLQQAAKEFSVNIHKSYVIGDKALDVKVGRAAGAYAILVRTGYGETALDECHRAGVVPDFVAPTILEAVNHIVHHLEGESSHHA
jgi:D-glycero-D-manno-heptose 1,7-bisphosphate phosphatase